MTNRLNYCTHAIEDITDLMSRDLPVAEFHSYSDAVTLLKHAEKFIMPEWGRIFTKEEWEVVKGDQHHTRLPYPVIALEYSYPYSMGYGNMLPKELPASRRICLAAEYEALKSLTPMYLGQMAERFPIGDKEGFYIFSIFYMDELKYWTPPPTAIFIPRSCESPKDTFYIEGDTLNFTTAHLALLPLGRQMYDMYAAEDRLERVARDLADEALALYQMQAALSIDKGRHETIPAPERLNKKRAKKNKPPLYEYKILDIVADVIGPSTEKVNGREGGHHASPRLHTRRGHVRKLASGKTTWVRNTIVGKPGRGMIIKDYSVHE